MRTLRTILILSLSALLLAGCSKTEETEPTTAVPGPGAGPTMGENAASAVGDMMEGAKEKAREALSALKDEYTEQLQTDQSKIDALKETAKSFGDEKLNGLLGSLDDQLAAARDKIDEIQNADEGSIEVIRGELDGLMNKIADLYKQAMDRVKELQGGTPEMPEVPGG
jgi:Sec-independent protein translocase protein TatA